MDLQNGYKVIYEEIANGKRTFFADKLDGTAATKLKNVDGTETFNIGEYKLVFEKDGGIFGSTTGKVDDGKRITAFDTVFIAVEDDAPVQDDTASNVEDEEPGVVEDEDEPETDNGEEEPGDETGDETGTGADE